MRLFVDKIKYILGCTQAHIIIKLSLQSTTSLNCSCYYRAVGKFNRKEDICYLPVGDKVFPYFGDGIELLANINGLIVVEFKSGGFPPTHLSRVAGTGLFKNPRISCNSVETKQIINSVIQRTNEAGQKFCCEAILRNRFPSCRRVTDISYYFPK